MRACLTSAPGNVRLATVTVSGWAPRPPCAGNVGGQQPQRRIPLQRTGTRLGASLIGQHGDLPGFRLNLHCPEVRQRRLRQAHNGSKRQTHRLDFVGGMRMTG